MHFLCSRPKRCTLCRRHSSSADQNRRLQFDSIFKRSTQSAIWQNEWFASDVESAPWTTKFDKINGTNDIRHFEVSNTCVWSVRNKETPSASNTRYQNVHWNLIIIDFEIQFFNYSYDFFIWDNGNAHLFLLNWLNWNNKIFPK